MAAGLIGVGLFATPASAHTPKWTVTCSEVSVDLTDYESKVTNTVTITVDGKDLLPTEKVGSEFHKKLELPRHSKEATVRLVVKAGDGDQFSHDDTKSSPVCETTPEPTTAPPSPSATPSDTPSEDAPAPSSEAPGSAPAAPAGKDPSDDLAETGASSSTPVIAGTAAAVVLAGGGILVATRKRRAARH
jgi:LPXTG-motif cell wall-anchored protein